ncbi:hypothetical protein [Robertkochia aurantiaca]|uniref:hypothetical protein n=1 Tax=Robertkochia aurantiaca TaxID=2873700 RepID=UPI001CC95ABA|nr:hypothetical protein [Robertkochia sp. 3YJGBD-33]
MKKYSRLILLLFLANTLAFCGGDSGGEEPTPETPTIPPAAATLTAPANNELCVSGTTVNAELSEVAFSWEPSEHTDSYDLEITNLNSGVLSVYNSTTPGNTASLVKGEPYEWKVVSKQTNSNDEAISETWKFYLEGSGETNYAPFPAEIVSPAPGTSVNPSGGIVQLAWKGSDVDNTELRYDIYLDTNDQPSTLIAENLTIEDFEVTDLTSGTTYFWKVVSKDAQNNTSNSLISSFKVAQ